MGCCGNASNE
jgi:acetyl esterase